MFKDIHEGDKFKEVIYKKKSGEIRTFKNVEAIEAGKSNLIIETENGPRNLIHKGIQSITK